MPDLNDDLFSSFKTGGPPVDPMPASEVRRRGDRRRRRTTTLATVGGVAAALAALAVPLAVLDGGSGTDREISPAPPAARWLQQVPADFPLAAGYAPGSTRDEVDPSIPAACGTPFWATSGTSDVAGVTVVGGEAFEARTLAVYPDQAAAERALADLRDAVADCPEQTVQDEGPDTTLVYDVLDSDLPTEDAFVFVERVRFDDGLVSDATTTQVGRTGNALLLDQSYSSAGDDGSVSTNLSLQRERAGAPFAAMCRFAADPCEEVAAPSPAPTRGDVIPGDFPLLDGYPDRDEGGEHGPTGPSRDLAPLVPEACGARAELPEHTDLLRSGFSNPEDHRERQLVTFADERAARAYVDAVLAVFDDCLEVPEGDLTRLTQVITEVSGIGDSAGGAVTRYESGGQPVPGMSSLVVVRVGTAVLVSTHESEGSGGTDPAAAVQDEFTRHLGGADGVIEAMGDLAPTR